MIGHKQNFLILRQLLEEMGVPPANRSHTQFCQGYVMRWGLAWTWEKNLHLKSIPVYKKPKEKPPFQYVVPDVYWEDVSTMYKKIKTYLDELEVRNYFMYLQKKPESCFKTLFKIFLKREKN